MNTKQKELGPVNRRKIDQNQLKGFKKDIINTRRRERIRGLSNDYFVETVLWPRK